MDVYSNNALKLVRIYKNRIFVLLFILLALVLRVGFLDRVPVGLSNDELDYLLNAKAVFLQGSDISASWNPLLLTPPTSSFPQAEIPPLLTFILVGLMPLSLVASKFIYAILNVGIVIVICLITKKLINQRVALIAGFVAAINPWLIFFGRTAYDTPVAVLFYLLGIYVVLVTKGWKTLLSFPLFFVAFYSYIGTKLLFIPIITITIFYSWFYINKKKFTKQYLVLVALSVILFAFFLSVLFTSNGTRVGEISTPNSQAIADIVNRERKLAIDTPLLHAFSNKYFVFLKYSFEKYINAFSPNFLFVHGDPKSLFTVWEHGVFYILDALFLIGGFLYLWIKKRKAFLFFVALIAISPIPSVVSNLGSSYAIRSFFIAPLFIIIIASGIYAAISYKKRYQKIVVVGIIGLYFLSLLQFMNIYLFRNPIYNSESFNLSSRSLAKYLSFQKEAVYVVSGTKSTPFKHFIFYNSLYNSTTNKVIAKMYQQDSFIYNNINFIACDKALSIPKEATVIYETGAKCKSEPQDNFINISQLSDGGAIYKIINDTVCQEVALDSYVSSVTFSDLQIESLSVEEFCQRFITKS